MLSWLDFTDGTATKELQESRAKVDPVEKESEDSMTYLYNRIHNEIGEDLSSLCQRQETMLKAHAALREELCQMVADSEHRAMKKFSERIGQMSAALAQLNSKLGDVRSPQGGSLVSAETDRRYVLTADFALLQQQVLELGGKSILAETDRRYVLKADFAVLQQQLVKLKGREALGNLVPSADTMDNGPPSVLFDRLNQIEALGNLVPSADTMDNCPPSMLFDRLNHMETMQETFYGRVTKLETDAEKMRSSVASVASAIAVCLRDVRAQTDSIKLEGVTSATVETTKQTSPETRVKGQDNGENIPWASSHPILSKIPNWFRRVRKHGDSFDNKNMHIQKVFTCLAILSFLCVVFALSLFYGLKTRIEQHVLAPVDRDSYREIVDHTDGLVSLPHCDCSSSVSPLGRNETYVDRGYHGRPTRYLKGLVNTLNWKLDPLCKSFGHSDSAWQRNRSEYQIVEDFSACVGVAGLNAGNVNTSVELTQNCVALQALSRIILHDVGKLCAEASDLHENSLARRFREVIYTGALYHENPLEAELKSGFDGLLERNSAIIFAQSRSRPSRVIYDGLEGNFNFYLSDPTFGLHLESLPTKCDNFQLRPPTTNGQAAGTWIECFATQTYWTARCCASSGACGQEVRFPCTNQMIEIGARLSNSNFLNLHSDTDFYKATMEALLDPGSGGYKIGDTKGELFWLHFDNCKPLACVYFTRRRPSFETLVLIICGLIGGILSLAKLTCGTGSSIAEVILARRKG